jgi:hypothetical protein
MSARLRVPEGTPDQTSGGERSDPSQVYSRGISAWWAKAGEVMVKEVIGTGMVGSPPGVVSAAATAAGQGIKASSMKREVVIGNGDW